MKEVYYITKVDKEYDTEVPQMEEGVFLDRQAAEYRAEDLMWDGPWNIIYYVEEAMVNV